MPNDYILPTEAACDSFLANFFAVLAANIAPLGVTPEQMTLLATAHTNYLVAETQRKAGKSSYNGLVKGTVTHRDALKTQVRDLVKLIQLSPNMTDSLRSQLRITVVKTTRTSVSAPTTVPVLTLSIDAARQHIIEFADSATPKTKAKPTGVSGCQLYELIVPAGSPPPIDPTTIGFLALVTRVPYAVTHDAADIGKTAYYVGCWQNAKGEAGPYGAIRGLTIAG